MRTSLIKRIESYAQKNPFWISGQTYGRLADAAGYKSDTASRRLRELHTAGILERREVKGHVEYRWREPQFHISPGLKASMEHGLSLTILAREEKQKVEKVEAGVQKALV